MLIGSGLCPAFFYSNSLECLPLNKVLDILEEHDFVECIDVLATDRSYRFNFSFLSYCLSQMQPFRSFKIRVHCALAEFHRQSQPVELIDRGSTI